MRDGDPGAVFEVMTRFGGRFLQKKKTTKNGVGNEICDFVKMRFSCRRQRDFS